VLDLGCGKGRFAAALAREGAEVIGLDCSAAMLAAARGLDRVRGSARRLPFASACFDAVVAVEVFEHLPGNAIGTVLREARRVLRPGGVLAIVDKNAGSWNARRPWLPNRLVKWIDERRGRWMYPAGGPVRERWFRPRAFAARLGRAFVEVQVEYLLSPNEKAHPLFRLVPSARLLTLWSARVPGGTHV
jgi:2-polyprenyl-6-hydroxyphenyl methylase/3-demethylubiquinone-9 3-methyltransferase